MSSAFDTLSALRDLEASGLDARHAEAIVQVVSDSHQRIATKADHDALKDEFLAFGEDMKSAFAALRQEFAALRQEMDDGFAALRKEMDDGFAALRKEMGDGFAAMRKENEGNLAVLRGQFQADLSSTVNKMLLAQLAVGGLIVALLKLL